MTRDLIIIPARLGSTRLDGKLFLEYNRKTLLEYTYQAASVCHDLAEVVIASDDDAILKLASSWCRTVRTGSAPNGTTRAAEAMLIAEPMRGRRDHVIVWQADEPEIRRETIVHLLEELERGRPIATAYHDLTPDEKQDRNMVKVIHSKGMAHWFCRDYVEESGGHVGIYAFQHFVLSRIAGLVPSPLAISQSLEQLTWLEHHFPIGLIKINYHPISVNCYQDWYAFTAKEQTLCASKL